ncbi:DUF4288 domain-containing protein [Hydrotalea sp.]|uniref:DUF4288 domain-containing protein n=1 Tax=Hydrotalea sp. TaxID=2881279 RepID=UPI003D095D6F
MKYYIAKMVFKIQCGNGKHVPQFDEQIRLFYANSANIALQKAINTGNEEAQTFFNNNHQLVQWIFLGITDLFEIEKLTDGIELSSCIKEIDEAENYEYFTQKKAAQLQEKLLLTHTII